MDRRTFCAGLLGAVCAPNLAAAQHLYSGTRSHVPGWRARYFAPWEFASKGNGQVQVTVALVSSLDQVRDQIRRRIDIISGFRDTAHNARVGGARHSRHLISDAVDLNLAGWNADARRRLVRLLVQHGFTSFGSYGHIPNMLHADMRPVSARWHRGPGVAPTWLMGGLSDAGWRHGRRTS